MGGTRGLEGTEDGILAVDLKHILNKVSREPPSAFKFWISQDFSITIFEGKGPYILIFKHAHLLLPKFEQHWSTRYSGKLHQGTGRYLGVAQVRSFGDKFNLSPKSPYTHLTPCSPFHGSYWVISLFRTAGSLISTPSQGVLCPPKGGALQTTFPRLPHGWFSSSSCRGDRSETEAATHCPERYQI